MYGFNVSFSLLGGEIYNDNGATVDSEIITDGGLTQVYGATEMDGPILLFVAQNVPSVVLAEGFDFSFKLSGTVDANTEYLFLPYEGYVYTAGDEDRIVCVNDGVIVEWDETEQVFRTHLA
jgi:roadblock/LC7 domain-containing protein